MKQIIISFLLLFSSTSIAKPINTGWLSSDAIKGYDAVAYFTEKKAVKGSDEFTHQWSGAKWKFSSLKNLELFKEKPEKYAPQYGGYCAFAMANGKKVSIDPESFDIRSDKLYLNYNKSVQKKWKSNAIGYIKSADSEWSKID